MRELTFLENVLAICITLLFLALVYALVSGVYTLVGINNFKYLISIIIVVLLVKNKEESK